MRLSLNRLPWLVAALVALSAAGAVCRAQAPAPADHQLKAAYLFKFLEYVAWPEGAFPRQDSELTIGVLGAEPLAGELAQVVAGRKANDRSISVRRIKAGEAPGGVHILFVGKSETARLNQLRAVTQPRPILIVTESEGALEQGSMINFVLADRRVRFEISLDSAERSGLKLSSRLLAVAQQVRTGTP